MDYHQIRMSNPNPFHQILSTDRKDSLGTLKATRAMYSQFLICSPRSVQISSKQRECHMHKRVKPKVTYVTLLTQVWCSPVTKSTISIASQLNYKQSQISQSQSGIILQKKEKVSQPQQYIPMVVTNHNLIKRTVQARLYHQLNRLSNT